MAHVLDRRATAPRSNPGSLEGAVARRSRPPGHRAFDRTRVLSKARWSRRSRPPGHRASSNPGSLEGSHVRLEPPGPRLDRTRVLEGAVARRSRPPGHRAFETNPGSLEGSLARRSRPPGHRAFETNPGSLEARWPYVLDRRATSPHRTRVLSKGGPTF